MNTDADCTFTKIQYNYLVLSADMEIHTQKLEDAQLSINLNEDMRYNQTRFSNIGNNRYHDMIYGISELKFLLSDGLSFSNEVKKYLNDQNLNRVRAFRSSKISSITTTVVYLSARCDS